MAIFRIFYAAALFFIEKIAPLFSAKLRRRQGVWRETVHNAGVLISEQRLPVVWFHAASAGEFEQAKPVIELLKSSTTPFFVVVSFFSPSGYEVHRNYKFADAIIYLPLDSFFSVRYFLRHIRPDIAVIVRYELWFELLWQLRQHKTPVLLISATFPARHFPFFTSVLTAMLRAVTTIYTASNAESEKFRLFVLSSTTLISATDTRFDRISSVVQSARATDSVLPPDFFAPDDIILVAGSTWPDDEHLLASVLDDEKFTRIRCIFVPHEVNSAHLNALQLLVPDAILLSDIQLNKWRRHIIVDSYGALLRLYRYAHIAYVGGGFGTGVHSTAEPAGYGIPILSGMNIRRSPDAIALQNVGGLLVINNEDELKTALEALVVSPEKRSQAGAIAAHYISSQTGTSNVIAQQILKLLARK